MVRLPKAAWIRVGDVNLRGDCGRAKGVDLATERSTLPNSRG